MRVVVDSNFVVRLLTQLRPNPYAVLWQGWLENDIEVHSTLLLWWEATNAFHRMALAGDISHTAPALLMQLVSELDIRYSDVRDDHISALEVAQRFKAPAAYDAHYVVLAQRLDCDLWTADKKLHRLVSGQLPWVRLADD
ncbi:MAG TPA: type II toxin-antitoxin system VapC family toxin [Thermomicrobiales bacterium]|jgi:predicted nucleic acid-binding protein|nr:type II toxin-antitoxin system VapC family toxin [Thermomicrobiales bacterium]